MACLSMDACHGCKRFMRSSLSKIGHSASEKCALLMLAAHSSGMFFNRAEDPVIQGECILILFQPIKLQQDAALLVNFSVSLLLKKLDDGRAEHAQAQLLQPQKLKFRSISAHCSHTLSPRLFLQ